MNKHLSILVVLLGVQLLLIVGMVVFDHRASADASDTFLNLGDQEVDGVTIEGPEGESVVLHRIDGRWMVEAQDSLPADSKKVTAMLEKLRRAKAPWPVGATADVENRFEVSDEKFQRHIKLLHGDDLVADIYLGTSPGFRKVHARRAGSTQTYAIEFSNFEASVKPEDWLDKTLLKPGAELSSITREGDWTLTRTDSGWQLEGLKEGQAADPKNIQTLVDKLQNLRVSGWAAQAQTLKLGAPLFTLQATLKDAPALEYSFFQPETEGDYLVKSSGHKGLYTLAVYNGEPLNQTREDLLLAPDDAEKPSQESEAP